MEDRNKTTDMIRGGQQFTLSLTMFIQNAKKHFKLLLLLSGIFFVAAAYYTTDETHSKWAMVWYKSHVHTEILKGNANKLFTVDNGGKPLTMTWRQFNQNKSVIQFKDEFESSVKRSAWLAVGFFFVLTFFHLKFITGLGRDVKAKKHKRGTEVGDHSLLRRELKESCKQLKSKRGESRFSIFDMPIPPGFENSGIALVGSPGVGKSTELFSLADQFRSQGKRMMIYDKGGEFASRYYREGKDIILNPFDARSAGWDVWCEGKNELVYRSIVNALIPSPDKGDPIWTNAPRSVLAHVIKLIAERSAEPENSALMRVVYRMETKKMAAALRGTDAAAIFNTDAEKFASSIRGIIGTYAECIKYMDNGQKPFSISDWVRNEDSDAWVFVTVKDEQADILAPLVTVWFEVFSKAFLSLEPSYNRSFGLGLDELTTLQKIPSLANAINLGRKYGLVPLLGYQSPNKLAEVYGDKEAKTLIDAMSIYCAFRINGADGAKESAAQFGTQDIERGMDGYTVGQADTRDSTNVNRQAKDGRSVVLPSEITSLMDEECFINFHRGFTISKVRSRFNKPDATVPYFVPVESRYVADETVFDGGEIVEDIDAYLDRIEVEVEQEEKEKLEALQANRKGADIGNPTPAKTQSQLDNDDTFVS